MKTIPVTEVLLEILKEAASDSYQYIEECEADLDKYSDKALEILLYKIEKRRQHVAVIKDLLDRYA